MAKPESACIKRAKESCKGHAQALERIECGNPPVVNVLYMYRAKSTETGGDDGLADARERSATATICCVPFCPSLWLYVQKE